MCSQRDRIMNWRFQNDCVWACAARGTWALMRTELMSAHRLVVIERYRAQLDIGGQLRLRGISVAVDLVAIQAVAAMLARGFDQYGVTARLDHLAAVVFAVPFE